MTKRIKCSLIFALLDANPSHLGAKHSGQSARCVRKIEELNVRTVHYRNLSRLPRRHL